MTLLVQTGCNHIKEPNSTIFLRNDLDLSYIRRVTVLSFGHVTCGEFNARRIQEILIKELNGANRFEVVEKKSVDALLRGMTMDTRKTPDGLVLKNLAKKLEVDAFFTGRVNRIKAEAGGRRPIRKFPCRSI